MVTTSSSVARLNTSMEVRSVLCIFLIFGLAHAKQCTDDSCNPNPKADVTRPKADVTRPKADVTRPKAGVTPTPSGFVLIGDGKHCKDRSSILKQSSGKKGSLAACQQSCLDTSGCQGVTYYPRGFCSHFSSMCDNAITVSSGALSYKLHAEPSGT